MKFSENSRILAQDDKKGWILPLAGMTKIHFNLQGPGKNKTCPGCQNSTQQIS
jgi:hypothetical protein